MIDDIETPAAPAAPETETPAQEPPARAALRAYAEKLLKLLPDGWSLNVLDYGCQATLIPPGEEEGWFTIYPDRDSYEIRDRVFYRTIACFRAKHPHRGVARRIAEEYYPQLAEKVATERQQVRIRQERDDAQRALCAELASVCQRTKPVIRDSFGIDLYIEDGPNWYMTARPHDGTVSLSLAPVTMEQAQAILRLLDL